MTPEQPGHTPSCRRRVYYLSGFDPRGARFYHQLYKTEAARQEPIDGCTYQVGKREKSGLHSTSWLIRSARPQIPGDTETRYTFLGWDDLIREHWPAGTASIVAAMPAYYWRSITNGGLGKTLRCAPRIFATIVSPLFYLLLVMLCAVLAAMATAWLVGQGVHNELVKSMAGLAVAAGLVTAAQLLAEKLRLFWLMRILLFVLHWGRTRPDALEQRWAASARRIHEDLLQDAASGSLPDEVLLVGHSVGALAAIAVADHYLGLSATTTQTLPGLKLLTLGSITPMLGMIPQAQSFREQLSRVGQSGMPWTDYTAPADPLCYRLVDPFAMCGLVAPTSRNHHIRSSRFDRMFTAADYSPLRRDAFRIHFQYLMATGLPVDNDYFSLTAGPLQRTADGSHQVTR